MEIEADSQERNNLTPDEIQALRGLLQSYPVHNHDGRNSLEVATSTVKKANDAYKIILPTSAVMGEDADDGNAVRIGVDNVDDYLRMAVQQTGNNSYWEMWGYPNQTANKYQTAQSFKIITSKISERVRYVILYFYLDLNAGQLTLDICSDNNGVPGSVLKSSSVNTNGNYGELTFGFSDLVLEPNTLYWLKVRVSSASSGNSGWYCRVYYNSASNSYPYGQAKVSSDYGSTWSDLNYDLYFKIQLCDTNGRIYKALSTTNTLVARYVGILDGAYTSGQTPRIIAKGVKSNYNDLAPGSIYYLTDTPGVISTSPGTITKQVAVAIDKNNLLII